MNRKVLRGSTLCLTAGCVLVFFYYYIHSEPTDKYIKIINDDSNVTSYVSPTNVLLNLNNFQYLLESTACQSINQNEFAIQIVTSYAGHVEARSALRQAYPASFLQSLGITRVFLLSKLPKWTNDITQSAIENEHVRFNDLVQGNFIESYKNLTYKHIMGLKWAITNCPNYKYIIKMDDDILVSMTDLVQLIKSVSKDNIDIMGYVEKNMLPKRVKQNKWYVSTKEYSRPVYPTFVSGWLYVISPQIARQLVIKAQSTPMFWIDDVYVTGILAESVQLSFTDIKKYFSAYVELTHCCMRDRIKCDYIISPSGDDYSLQTKFKNYKKQCILGHCKQLTNNMTIEKICVAEKLHPPLLKGVPQVNIIEI